MHEYAVSYKRNSRLRSQFCASLSILWTLLSTTTLLFLLHSFLGGTLFQCVRWIRSAHHRSSISTIFHLCNENLNFLCSVLIQFRAVYIVCGSSDSTTRITDEEAVFQISIPPIFLWPINRICFILNSLNIVSRL